MAKGFMSGGEGVTNMGTNISPFKLANLESMIFLFPRFGYVSSLQLILLDKLFLAESVHSFRRIFAT